MSVRSASSLIGLQVLSRGGTFALNQALVRLASPTAFGAAAIQFELVLSTILFLSREGVRTALLRAPPPTNAAPTFAAARRANTAFIPVVVGVPLALATALFYVRIASEEVHAQPTSSLPSPSMRCQPSSSCSVSPSTTCASPMLPRHSTNPPQRDDDAADRSPRACRGPRHHREEPRDIRRTHPRPPPGWLDTRSRRLCWRPARVPASSCSPRTPRCSARAICGQQSRPRASSHSLHVCHLLMAMIETKRINRGVLISMPKTVQLAGTLTVQSVVKHFLTEGDKLILAWLSPLRDQGGYAIAVNYGEFSLTILPPCDKPS